MAFMFGQPGGFWGAMQSAWPNFAQRAPRNVQGPMSWGQQHQQFSPYQPTNRFPFAPQFGFQSPFMPYGTGMSYLMPTSFGGFGGFGGFGRFSGVGGGQLPSGSQSSLPSPAPPYGSYPGMMPGFGMKPAGAPYDVDPQTGVVEQAQQPVQAPPPAARPAPVATGDVYRLGDPNLFDLF